MYNPSEDLWHSNIDFQTKKGFKRVVAPSELNNNPERKKVIERYKAEIEALKKSIKDNPKLETFYAPLLKKYRQKLAVLEPHLKPKSKKPMAKADKLDKPREKSKEKPREKSKDKPQKQKKEKIQKSPEQKIKMYEDLIKNIQSKIDSLKKEHNL